MLKDTRKKNVRGNSSSVQASEVFCSGLRNSFYGLTTQVMGRVRPNVPKLQQVGESTGTAHRIEDQRSVHQEGSRS